MPQSHYQSSNFFNVTIPNEQDLVKFRQERGNAYYQAINGLTTMYSNGERKISLFNIANQSTFLHESAHVFFDDIKRLAEMDGVPKQIQEDWKVLKEWSGWDDTEGADNTAAHEKFASGFEAYVRDGKAPVNC